MNLYASCQVGAPLHCALWPNVSVVISDALTPCCPDSGQQVDDHDVKHDAVGDTTMASSHEVVRIDDVPASQDPLKSIDLFDYRRMAPPMSSSLDDASAPARRRKGQVQLTTSRLPRRGSGKGTAGRKRSQQSIKDAFGGQLQQTGEEDGGEEDPTDIECVDAAPKRIRRKKGDPLHWEWVCKGFHIETTYGDGGEVELKRARCRVCHNKMWKTTNYRVFKKGSNESWTGCVKHMEKTHGIVNTQKLEAALAEPPVSGQTVLGEGMAPYMDTWGPRTAQWDKAIDSLGKLVCTLNLPFQLGQRVAFVNFMRRFVPRWPTISRQALTRNIKRQSKAIQERINKEMREVSAKTGVAMTCDIWSSRGNQGYLTCTLHWLDDGWVLRRHILGAFSGK